MKIFFLTFNPTFSAADRNRRHFIRRSKRIFGFVGQKRNNFWIPRNDLFFVLQHIIDYEFLCEWPAFGVGLTVHFYRTKESTWRLLFDGSTYRLQVSWFVTQTIVLNFRYTDWSVWQLGVAFFAFYCCSFNYTDNSVAISRYIHYGE